MRFQFIDEHQGEFPVGMMCQVLKVSCSGFFCWRKRGIGKREESNQKLLRKIEDIHKASRKTYGSPRILEQLWGMGEKVSKGRVERLMKTNNIRAKTKKKFRVTTDSKHSHPVAPNLLDRNFQPEGANQAWAGDITYIPTEEGWLYLAVVLDLYNRQVVGWSMSDRITQELTLSALRMAIKRRDPGEGLIHHSDRGSQYACRKYRRTLEAHAMICSMSRKGNCWDNAPVESFFHTLKTEFIFHENFKTRKEAKTKIFEWIEVFYNRIRLHSFLGYMSPVAFELDNKSKVA